MKRIEYLIWSALCLILVSCEAPVVDDFGVRLPEEPLAVNGCVVDTDGAPMEAGSSFGRLYRNANRRGRTL